MLGSLKIALLAVLLLVVAGGCAKKDQPFRKQTVPVKGQITVDGSPPGSAIKIFCHDKGPEDTEHPTVSWCLTDAEGRFSLNTYETGDGVPPGEYTLTFLWGEMNAISRSYGGPDKLNKRYEKPEDSPVTFRAEVGKPVDLGTVDLTKSAK